MKKAPEKRAKTSSKGIARSGDEMRAHYDFDYATSRPNRFATRFKEETIAVVLDADVADVFPSSESVNTVLRSAIRAMRSAGAKTPKPSSKKKAS